MVGVKICVRICPRVFMGECVCVCVCGCVSVWLWVTICVCVWVCVLVFSWVCLGVDYANIPLIPTGWSATVPLWNALWVYRNIFLFVFVCVCVFLCVWGSPSECESVGLRIYSWFLHKFKKSVGEHPENLKQSKISRYAKILKIPEHL